MIYDMTGAVERVITETFRAEVEANDPEEARDLLYEVLSSYPNSELSVKRLLTTSREAEGPLSITVEFAQEMDDNDEED